MADIRPGPPGNNEPPPYEVVRVPVPDLKLHVGEIVQCVRITSGDTGLRALVVEAFSRFESEEEFQKAKKRVAALP